MKDWREKPSRVSHPVLTGVHGQDENGEEIVIDSSGSLAELAEKKKGRRCPGVKAPALQAIGAGVGNTAPSRATIRPSNSTSVRGGCAAIASGTLLAAIVKRVAAPPTATP